jgi:hypothetical protein
MWICLGKEISNENTPLIVLLPMHWDSLKKLKILGEVRKIPPPPPPPSYPQKTSLVILI